MYLRMILWHFHMLISAIPREQWFLINKAILIDEVKDPYYK